MPSEASEPEICAFGVWSVEQPVVDGRPLAMAADHADQWRRLRFDLPNWVHVQRMDFTLIGYSAVLDEQTETLVPDKIQRQSLAGKFQFESPGHWQGRF